MTFHDAMRGRPRKVRPLNNNVFGTSTEYYANEVCQCVLSKDTVLLTFK